MEQVIREESLPQARARERVRGGRDDTARLCAVPTALLVLFIVIPLAALVWRAIIDPAFWPSMAKPMVFEAPWVTLITSAATLLVSLAMGTPLAYLLAQRQFPGKWLIETISWGRRW
jgi:ABC-type sulfate transport system permease component